MWAEVCIVWTQIDSRLIKLVGEFDEIFDKDKIPKINIVPLIIKLKETHVSKCITDPKNVHMLEMIKR